MTTTTKADRMRAIHDMNKRLPCANCGTTRYPIKAKEHCSRCYPLALRLEHTLKWDASKPETLRKYPEPDSYMPHSGKKASTPFPPDHWIKEFPKIKAYTIRELRKRLLHFKLVENCLSSHVTGCQIEEKLRYLARCAGCRNKRVLFGIAGGIEVHFNHKQRRLLLKWLNEISEGIKWKGINSWAALWS